MAAFSLSADTNIDALSGKTGGDTYDTNGFKLTIDQDSRVGTNQTTSTTLGSITINASKGGDVHIDGTGVWMIPYTGGSGNVPAWNTSITQSGQSGSGKLIGVHSALTAASTATGAAMPASGYIRVKQKTGTYASGALTGITATASNAGSVGWLEIVGDEAATVNANRLGTFRVTGALFQIGTTSGSSNQTMQIPSNGLLRYCAGVFIQREAPRAATYTWANGVVTVSLSSHGFIEKEAVELAFTSGGATANATYLVTSVVDASTFTVALAGSGTSGNVDVEFLEFWPNAGTTTTTGTEAARGKVVWIDNAGLCRIGNSGAATNGHTPGSGLKVYVPNIFLENCTTASRTANVIPNATIATRYDFTTTGGGPVVMDKVNCAWYGSFSQAYSVTLSYCGFVDAINFNEIGSPLSLIKVGVGNKPTTALSMSPLTMTYIPAGGLFSNCVWARVAMAASGAHINLITDAANLLFVRDTIRANTIRGNSNAFAGLFTRVVDSKWMAPILIQGLLSFVTSARCEVYDTVYIDAVSGTTVTTYTGYVWAWGTNCVDCLASGLTFPVTNNHPYTAVITIAVACARIKVRNIATRASPLNLGSANATGLLYTIASGSSDIKLQRIYCSNTRTNLMTSDNTCTKFTEENVHSDYADAPVTLPLNMRRKGVGATITPTAQVCVYGSHWVDCFTSTTAGRLILLMNEPTAETASLVTLTGGAAFTAVGSVYMPTIAQSITVEMDYYALGHTGFQNSALVMAGGTAGNYTYEYAIDKNDGNGFSAMTSSAYTAAQLGTALNALTGIDASKGLKLKLKITTGTTNTTAITSVYVLTDSSTTAQDYQYPLDTNKLTLTNIVSGSDVVVLTNGATTVLASSDAQAGTTFEFVYSAAQTVDVCVYKSGYVPYILRGIVLTMSDSSLPMQQVVDPSYLE